MKVPQFKYIRSIFLLFFLTSALFSSAQCPIVGDSVVCENETILYTTSSVGAVYLWNAYPGVVTGAGNSVTVGWTGTGTGVVTLVVKDAYGAVICSGTKNVTIYEEPTPFITPSFIASCSNDSSGKGEPGKDDRSCMSVCDSSWVTYTTIPHAGNIYTWTIIGSATVVPSTTNSIQVFWTGVGAGLVKVIETNIYGCSGETELCVTVVEKPNAGFTSIPAAVSGLITTCLNQDIIFINGSNDGGGSPLWSYTWIWGDGSQDNVDADGWDGTITHAYNTSGTYTVTLIAENECHCKDTAFITVQVLSDPGPEIECVSTVCPGSSVTYSTNSDCSGYAWSVTNGAVSGSSTDSTVTVIWGSTGPSYLSLATLGCTPATCPVATTVEIPVIVPNASISGPDLVCDYDCNTYRISCTIPIDSIVWHFPSGITVLSDTVNVHEVEVCFYNPAFDTGTVYVEYFHTTPGSVDDLSCGGVAILNLKQRPKINLGSFPEICDNSTFNLFYTNTAATFDINISDGVSVDTTFAISASTNYSSTWVWGPGLFTITLSDTSGYYCNSPESTTLVVNENPPPPLGIVGADTVCPLNAYEYNGISTSSEFGLVWTSVGATGGTNNVGPIYPLVWGASPPYQLCLIQIDPETNCKSPSICDTIVSASPLAPAVISGPDTVCNNGQQSYTAASFATSYDWSVSPAIAGSVVLGQGGSNTTIEWNNWTGVATLSVIARGCGTDSAITTYSVLVIGTPVPNITLPATICEDGAVTMSSSTSGATFIWDFGDGSSSVTGNPVTYAYNTPGNHIVTLTAVYSGTCNGEAQAFGSIMVYPKPDITISTPDPNIFCGTISNVNMFVASPVSGTSYQWYRSPSTSLSSGTSYTSNVLGSYYVIGINSYGCVGTSNPIIIDTSCSPPCRVSAASFVNFTRQRQGCNTDTFVGSASSGAINFAYDFDDPFGSPSTSSGINAIHTFPEPGFYRVEICADVPNASGTGYCRICRMKVDTVNYIADFLDSIYCTNGVDSLNVQLINNTKILSTAPTPSYAWSINSSGTLSTASDPLFTLPPGTYNIVLIVDGTCVKSKTIVIDSFPQASFTLVDSICENTPLDLINTSIGADSNAYWTFGDSASSLIYSPIKEYINAGNYTIQLLVVNAYGCSDSTQASITVLPNNLSPLITVPTDTLCQGDTVSITNATTGGYPNYSWLWSTVDTTQDISIFYTGTYYLDVVDSKGCKAKSNTETILFNPTPKPQITGPKIICYGTFLSHKVNYPNAGFTFEWSLNGTVATGWTNNSYTLTSTPGSYALAVKVSSSLGCIGYDTINVLVVTPPSTSITTTSGPICEGDVHLFIGNYSSTADIIASYWSNGQVTDSIYVSTSGQYTFTVVDSFGCSSSSARTVHPLPEFCGLITGCYTICDTIKELVWYAPKGYAQYQWLFNGTAVTGATSDTFHVPLYQSGAYQLVLWSDLGCADTSDFIDIEFVTCGDCKFEVKQEISCGPVDINGNPTYDLNLQVYNGQGAGAYLGLYTAEGALSGTSPTTLALGWNTVTTTFIDTGSANDTLCLNYSISLNNIRCDTTICIPIPPCEKDCELGMKTQKIDCAGFDSAGNPMYLFCIDVTWNGSSSSSLTLTTSSGSFTPNPIAIDSGINSLCFTYTDVLPYGNVAVFHFYVFDSTTHLTCHDSLQIQYESCEDSCIIGVFGICAHCKDSTSAGQNYNLELTVDNTLGTGANVSVLPISAGTFGTISPNPISSGLQTINIPFMDIPIRDSIICFRVILELDGHTCWQDVCMYLPDCRRVSVNTLKAQTYLSISPNPADNKVNIFYNSSGNSKNVLQVYDALGKKVKDVNLNNLQQKTVVDVSNLEEGIYFISFMSDGQFRGKIKLLVRH